MPDLIRAYVDVPAQPAEVYAYVAAPTTGPLVSQAREVVDVVQENGGVAAFRTKRGLVRYVTQAPPHYLESEYQQRQLRARYDIRVEAIGDHLTRISIDVNIQPQSLRAKLQGPLPRLRAKGQLNEWLEQVKQHFNARQK